MRVRPEVVSAVALSTALALVVLPAAEMIDPSSAFADPVVFADPAPGRIAYSSTDDYFQYLAATDDEGVEAPVLPQDVSPPSSSDEGDARAGLIAWVAEEDGRPILLTDGTTVTTVVPAVEGVYNYDPVISPDGTRIAFSMRDYRGGLGGSIHVWTINVDGSNPLPIRANETEPTESPTWSPDGESLAFSRWTATANDDIWTQHLGSGSRTRLTATVNADSDPTWSNDGLRIAFTAFGLYEDGEGNSITEIVSVPAGGGDVRRETYPFWPRASTEAVWAGPDSGIGSPIAFTSSSADGNTLGVYQRVAEGTVVEVSDLDDYTERHPFWSAELGKVGYTAGRQLPTSLIHTIQTDGADQQPFSDRWDDRDGDPVYSPDGTKLAFSRASGESADIVVADLVTGNETLLPGPRPGFGERFVDPAWSPDGRFIAFGREFMFFGQEEAPTPVSTIVVAELATGARTALPMATSPNEYNYSFDGEPSWDPVTSRLVFTRAWVPRGSGGEDPGGPILTVARAAFPEDTDTDLYLTAFPFPAGVPASQLTNDLGEDCGEVDCFDRGPAWSPADPAKIAFSRDFDTLNLVDPSSGAVTEIPVDNDSVSGVADPAWSPGALRLAFSGYQSEGPSSIFTMAAAGGEPTHLTSMPYYVGQPTWQPTADLMVTATADLGTIEYGMQDTLRVTVTNLGSVPSSPTVKLTIPPGLAVASITPDSGFCDPVLLTCTRGALAAQVPWVIVIVVTGVATGTHPVVADVTGTAFDPNPANNQAITRVTVGLPPNLALTGTITPSPGYVGGEKLVVTFTIQNTDEAFARQVTLDASFPVNLPPPISADPPACLVTNPCPIGDIEPSGTRTVTFTLDPTTAIDVNAVGVVNSFVTDPDPINNVAIVRVLVLQPVISTNPGLSAPGRVIQVHGENFPPGATVGFRWSIGISGGEQIVADANGKFDSPMLIFHREWPSARTINARHLGGQLFGSVKVPFLVVPGDQGPPDFVGRS